MNKNKADNITMNKGFLTWSAQADGKCDNTVNQRHYHLLKLTNFMGNSNYKKLTTEIIIDFKMWIKDSGVSAATYCAILKTIRKFLSWLMAQHGFKRKITSLLISYMSPTAEETRMAQQPAYRNLVSLDSVINLHNSIPDDTPIGMRDRAVVGTEITTGMRHKALITTPLSCLYLEEGYIHQDPRRGVQTKFKKNIKSAICDVNGIFLESIKKWEKYLRLNGFGDADPFIPCALKKYDPFSHCFKVSTDVEPKFWKSHTSLTEVLRKRCKAAGLPYFAPHNFRHLLVKMVKELDLSSKESKCFSQSLGHEHEDTTYGCYGKFSEDDVISTVSNIDFQQVAKDKDIDDDEFEEFQAYQSWKKMQKKLNKKNGNKNERTK